MASKIMFYYMRQKHKKFIQQYRTPSKSIIKLGQTRVFYG